MSSNVSSFKNSSLLEFLYLLEITKVNVKLFKNQATSDCEGGGGGAGGGCCSTVNTSLGDGDSVIRRAKVRPGSV